MYKNIGGKIQGLATLISVIGALVAIAVFSVIWYVMADSDRGGIGFLIGLCAGGIIFLNSWIGTWILYGYGSLVENSDNQVELLKKQQAILSEALGTKPKGSNCTRQQSQDNTPDSNAPYWCMVCGHPGPYERFCPKCGSTDKVHDASARVYRQESRSGSEKKDAIDVPAPEALSKEPVAQIDTEPKLPLETAKENPKKRFCNKCGTPFEDADTFCACCGNRLSQ